jgi:Flp pilus assembly pilin Flp
MKTVNKLRNYIRKQRGQGMTEYIIIVALIAVASIGVYSLFGRSVREQTAGLAAEVSGVNGNPQIALSQQASAAAARASATNKGLGNYNQANNHQAANATSAP